MKRALVSLKCIAAVTLGVLASPSATRAGILLLDNGIGVYAYGATVTPGTASTFSSTPETRVVSMATTIFDTSSATASFPYVVLAASDPITVGGGIYAYGPGGAVPTVFNTTTINNPLGLAVGSTGDVYTGANNGTAIEELSPVGAVLTANIVTSSDVGFGDDFIALAVDGAGDVFAVDNTTGNVNEYFAGGGSQIYNNPLQILDGGGNDGIAFDAAGDLFVTFQNGMNTGGIDIISPTGNISQFGAPLNVLPTDLSYDTDSGNLYMSYKSSSQGSGGGIDVFAAGPNGTVSTTESLFATSAGQPLALTSLAPEPGTWLLLGGGLLALSLRRFRPARR